MNSAQLFGARVRAKRIEMGLTQEELARAVGYTSRSTITKIESGERDLTRDKVAALAKALNADPVWLIGVNDDECSEAELVSLFRKCPQEAKETLLNFVRSYVAGVTR